MRKPFKVPFQLNSHLKVLGVLCWLKYLICCNHKSVLLFVNSNSIMFKESFSPKVTILEYMKSSLELLKLANDENDGPIAGLELFLKTNISFEILSLF